MMDRVKMIKALEKWKAELEWIKDSHTWQYRKKVLAEAIAALRDQEQRKWISAEEKPMPEGNEEYEVCCDYHGEKRIEIHKGWNTHCVTHWRPLPEPTEGGAEE